MSTDETFAQWVVLELMGHRQLSGYVTEAEIAGEGFLRLDVYEGDAPVPRMTQFYRPGAVYCITPTTEDIARSMADRSRPAPIAYELEAF